jgi:uncharacterized protein (TIGR03000 family)
VAVGTALVCLAAGEARAGGIGNAMIYGPYTGGHGYPYSEAYGYFGVPSISAGGFTGPWTYPYDWSSSPYRGLAFPARGTKGWPQVVPIPAEAELAGPPGPPAPAVVCVQVPSNAELWFDGARTEQVGPSRNFQSPPLAGGRTFHYVVRARWTENGQAVEQFQTVSVQGGQQAQVSFPQR